MSVLARRARAASLLPTCRASAPPRRSLCAAAASGGGGGGSPVSCVGVVGAGQMGTGIAIVAAQQAETPVLLFDTSAAQLEKAMTFAAKHLQRSVDKGRIDEAERDAVLGRIATTDQLPALERSDFVIGEARTRARAEGGWGAPSHEGGDREGDTPHTAPYAASIPFSR
jgi:hypothetical protein